MKKHSALTVLVTALFLGMALGCEQKQAEVNDESNATSVYQYEGEPLQVAVIGLVHTHVHWILGREEVGDIEIIGIVEPNRDLAEQYSEQHGYSMELVYPSMEALWADKQPEAVFDFGRIYDHLATVQFFAPKGVDIMVEKPLAVNWDHAQQMAILAEEHRVELLTNYETSWYGSTYQAKSYVQDTTKIGPVSRMVFNTGHPGPIEIGCNPEFLEWLTDPVLNGGGALPDFGCYGANISSWILDGAAPLRVNCITRQRKPNLYPKVEDEANIFLEYEQTSVQINASWDWSHNRKDMEVFGNSAFLHCLNSQDMDYLPSEEEGVTRLEADPLAPGFHDPFAYFVQVLKKGHNLEPYALASLENNLRVVQILEAARISAERGEAVEFMELFP